MTPASAEPRRRGSNSPSSTDRLGRIVWMGKPTSVVPWRVHGAELILSYLGRSLSLADLRGVQIARSSRGPSSRLRLCLAQLLGRLYEACAEVASDLEAERRILPHCLEEDFTVQTKRGDIRPGADRRRAGRIA